MKKKIIYWVFQILGWGFYGLVGIISLSYSNQNMNKWTPLILIQSAVLIYLTNSFRNYIIKKQFILQSIKFIFLRVFIIVIIISFISNIITSILMLYPFEVISWKQYNVGALFLYISNTAFFVTAWTGIYLTVSFISHNRKQQIEQLKLQVTAKESQINSLKAQINPHFIFNSLNNIRSLIFENPEQASDMLTYLSDLLRYSMKFNKSGKEKIRQEIEVVKEYLKLQSIHLEERLNYNLEIDNSLLEYEIPAMSIQLLVENSIKHGIQKLPNGGSIFVKVHKSETDLIIEVINTGKIELDESSTKIGLANATERLKLMFGNDSDIKLTQIDNNQVLAKLNIPIDKL